MLVDGVDVTPRAAKERALLALLVLDHDCVVGADRLIEELWPELTADRGRHALHVRIASLRKLLDKAHAGCTVQFVKSGYRLAGAAVDIDHHRFSALVAQAREQGRDGDAMAASTTLREAVSPWRGAPFADVQACPRLEAEATRLADEHASGLEELAGAELTGGRHLDWITRLEAMVAQEPFRERRWALLMLALYRCGRQVEALRAFQRARAALDDVVWCRGRS